MENKELKNKGSDNDSELIKQGSINVESKTRKNNKVTKEMKYDSTKLEDNVAQVLQRFKYGCECQDDQCFKSLNPEAVYRHRLNIAELTKAEHDMYLMGVTMACLTNPNQTARQTERRRLRVQYVYQGRRVCLDAFLYLENCTHYQIKRIRKHLVTHGVTPRVHGNHGKIPHNTFSLHIYKIATEFLKSFINKQEVKQKSKAIRNSPLYLPSEITRKTVHDCYKEYCKRLSPSTKVIGYSTFRRFMKVQFPQVKFTKLEFVVKPQIALQNNHENNKGDSDFKNSGKPVHSTHFIAENTGVIPIIITSNVIEEDNAYFITNGLLINKSGLPVTVANINS